MIGRSLKLPVEKSFFLFGPRQTGKTTLINSVFKERVYKINLLLSDQFLKYSKDPSLFRKEVLEKKNAITHVFIDEIQRVPELLNEVQYLIDTTSLYFILSGSSARLRFDVGRRTHFKPRRGSDVTPSATASGPIPQCPRPYPRRSRHPGLVEDEQDIHA